MTGALEHNVVGFFLLPCGRYGRQKRQILNVCQSTLADTVAYPERLFHDAAHKEKLSTACPGNKSMPALQRTECPSRHRSQVGQMHELLSGWRAVHRDPIQTSSEQKVARRKFHHDSSYTAAKAGRLCTCRRTTSRV